MITHYNGRFSEPSSFRDLYRTLVLMEPFFLEIRRFAPVFDQNCRIFPACPIKSGHFIPDSPAKVPVLGGLIPRQLGLEVIAPSSA